MITFYSGTPGSGKSLDVAREIIFWLKIGKPVIGNIYLNKDMIKKYKHRQFGFDCYLVAQWDKQIDPQIRALFEYEIKHRKGNNMGNIGFILSLFFGTFFVRMENWYGSGQRLGSTFFRYHKKWGKLYDSYMAFDENESDKSRNDLLPFTASN